MNENQSPLDFRFKTSLTEQATYFCTDTLPDAPGPVGMESYSTVIPPRMDVGEALPEYNPDWIAGILLACFLIIAWAKYNFGRRFKQVVLGCFSLRYLHQIEREGNLFGEQLTLGLSIVTLSSFGLLGYYYVERFTPEIQSFPNNKVITAALIAGFLFGGWLAKSLIHIILAFVFNTKEVADRYQLNNLIFHFFNGIFLLLLLPFIYYMSSSLVFYVAVAGSALIMAIKIIRSFIIGLANTQFPVSYLFIYILGIEVAPLLIIAGLFLFYPERIASLFP